MAKRTDEELLEYHKQKAKQAEARIKQREARMKEQQRKRENAIKYTLGGMMFKYFGSELVDLSRSEREAFANGMGTLFENNQNNINLFKERGEISLAKYQNEKNKKENSNKSEYENEKMEEE